MFSFSFVSLMFLSFCCSFFTCVVPYFSFSNVSHDRNEKCVFRARPQLKAAVQLLPKPLNTQEQGKIIAHPCPSPPACSVPLAGHRGGGKADDTEQAALAPGSALGTIDPVMDPRPRARPQPAPLPAGAGRGAEAGSRGWRAATARLRRGSSAGRVTLRQPWAPPGQP